MKEMANQNVFGRIVCFSKLNNRILKNKSTEFYKSKRSHSMSKLNLQRNYSTTISVRKKQIETKYSKNISLAALNKEAKQIILDIPRRKKIFQAEEISADIILIYASSERNLSSQSESVQGKSYPQI
eukprot:TRINITY_DN59343_c0_g1_i2.p1 TRINITY_DN59343_c0_g1~~TRINITY_DN59343_c0_g1_i2.p1  ORF type:complete len:134 (-),score=6.02 TRINITY_DN59343_c0_g1_i2:224-604(-)